LPSSRPDLKAANTAENAGNAQLTAASKDLNLFGMS
jgi:hypothetical protein